MNNTNSSSNTSTSGNNVTEVIERHFSGLMTEEEWLSFETLEELQESCPEEKIYTPSEVAKLTEREFIAGKKALAKEFIATYSRLFYGMDEMLNACAVILELIDSSDTVEDWKRSTYKKILES